MVTKTKRNAKGVTKKGAKGTWSAKAKYGGMAKKDCCKKIDKHYVDLAGATYAFDTVGSVTLVATIPTGATQTTRVGKKVILDSLQVRGVFTPAVTPVAAPAKSVLMYVYDKRPTGALPAITDILLAANASSMNNDDNSNRFKIIRRIERIHSSTVNISTHGLDWNIEEFIPLNKYAEYKSVGTGAIADIEEGAIYQVTCGSNAAAGSATAAITCRTRFHED